MVLIRAKKGKKIIIPKLAMWDNVSDHAEEINLPDPPVWKLTSSNHSLYYITLLL